MATLQQVFAMVRGAIVSTSLSAFHAWFAAELPLAHGSTVLVGKKRRKSVLWTKGGNACSSRCSLVYIEQTQGSKAIELNQALNQLVWSA